MGAARTAGVHMLQAVLLHELRAVRLALLRLDGPVLHLRAAQGPASSSTQHALRWDQKAACRTTWVITWAGE